MAACSRCGSELPDDAQFCPACGARTGGPVGEERKVVTVLFADLADSTSQADGRDPEDVRAVVRPQLARMRAEFERYGGTFEKYVGDAVMAVFGAPTAHEDDPERAVRAALAIRDAIGGVRVAVNTGEAVVSLAAASGAGEGIATGDVVNTAFRIEEAADADSVLVGETTYRATRGAIEYGERRLLQAKGKAEPVAVYEALRAAAELRPPLEGTPQAPLVGRREELGLVLDTLARAKRDRTVQLLTIVGVPGIGKSRIVWELQRALEDEPGLVTWRRGRCLPYGDGVTYWALGEMVKAHAGVLETDDARTVERKLHRAVADLLSDPAEAAWVESRLRPVLALEGAPAGGGREQAFAAWRRFFEALAESGPLVLVFEDLHWADEGLLDFIDHVADWSTQVPLVLLCTARPELHERRPSWGARANAATILLPPLTPAETARLVGFLLHQSLLPVELQQALLERAEGNPLYAEEFVRMLVDRGLLVRSGGSWQLRGHELPVPESVQAIIAARVDALGAVEKEVLRSAAVVGRAFWPAAVAAVGGVADGDVDAALRALERRELVRRLRTAPHGEHIQYSFHHALVRDVAYSQIPRAERGSKHASAARWTESLGRPEDYSETIAHHYVQALEYRYGEPGFGELARAALRDAGDRALALSSYGGAARYFASALELSPQPEADLLFGYARALFHGENRGQDELEAARDALLEQGERGRAAECESMLVWLAWYAGRHADAFTHLEKARELSVGLEVGRSRAEVLTSGARFLVVADEPDGAIPLALEALELSRSAGADDLRLLGLTYLGTARVSTGDVDGGIADLEAAIALGRELRSPEVVRSLVNLAAVHVGLGDLRRAFELHADARTAAAQVGHAQAARWLQGELVGETYWTRRWDDTIALADEFLSHGDHYLRAFCLTARGKVHLARGETTAASADAAEAVQRAREAADAQVLYPALAFAAEVALAQGDRETAITFLDELLDSYTGAELLTAGHAWASLSRVAVALGRNADVIAAASRARVRTKWLEAAELVAQGRRAEAAQVYARMGSAADAAAT